MLCRDSGFPHDTLNIVGTSVNVLNDHLFESDETFTFFNKSKNLASSSQELRPDITGNTKRPESETRREPQNSSILVPRVQSGAGLLNHTSGTYSHVGMIDFPRFPISELHLGKFPNSMEIQGWKSQFQN